MKPFKFPKFHQLKGNVVSQWPGKKAFYLLLLFLFTISFLLPLSMPGSSEMVEDRTKSLGDG
jgi:hypothetical protein